MNSKGGSSFGGYVLRWLTSIDLVMLLSLALLIALGSIILFSASGEDARMMNNHTIHLILATIVMLVATQLSSDLLKRWAFWIYIIGIVVLVLVLIQGSMGKGAQRWLEIGSLRFQPSEIMKLAVPMMVASYLSKKSLPPRFKEIFIATLLVAIPMLLIVKQPDLGTALLVGSAGFFVIYFAGLSWKWLGATLVAIIIAAPLVFYFGMHDYQRQRVLTLLDPSADRLGSGYHIYQSTIAIGSGGFYGKGWLNGDQSRLDFLPERHTDFIFAVFGEEFGLLGNLILFTLYLFIIWRGLYLAMKGHDTFARLLGGSLSLTFFIYLLVNTGMVSGILPVVGVPLPLISYGGTSLVTLMAAFGLLMGLRKRKRGYD
ncbi:rod shape-determining protein RodA [uncultured Cocleimonas sp.]|uniref:rod shape-determining protein RodA n=1 Tax=uncultured Cocleimonas sp. TaxID=1051587 RepID=UPI00261D99BD|nr:rod shape-determining protein RodA [uncultured Cocleimonas sp.]